MRSTPLSITQALQLAENLEVDALLFATGVSEGVVDVKAITLEEIMEIFQKADITLDK